MLFEDRTLLYTMNTYKLNKSQFSIIISVAVLY